MQGKALIGWLFNCVIMDQFKKTYCGQRINSCKYRQEFFFFKKGVHQTTTERAGLCSKEAS